VPVRHDQRVALGHRETIPQREDVIATQEHAQRVGAAEGAGGAQRRDSTIVISRRPSSPAAAQSAQRQDGMRRAAMRVNWQMGHE
jgi:hypothetical protein